MKHAVPNYDSGISRIVRTKYAGRCSIAEPSGKYKQDCGSEAVAVQANAEQINQVEKNRAAADAPKQQENQPNAGAFRFRRQFVFHVTSTPSSVAVPASSTHAGA
jgi:hypothetical protein